MEDCDAQLRRYAQEARLDLKYEEISTNDNDQDNTFTVRAVLSGKAYANGVGKTKDEATQDAAKKALSQVMQRVRREPLNTTKAAKPSGRSSGVESSKATDFIGMLTKYCNKKGKILNFLQTEVCGPKHKSKFCIKVLMDHKDYPEGVGKNKKEAQQKAAELAWSALQEQSDYDSKVSVFSTKSKESKSAASSPTAATAHAEVSSHSMVSSARRLLKTASSSQEPLKSAVSVGNAPTQRSTSTSLDSLPTLCQALPSTVDFVGYSANPFEDQTEKSTAVDYVSQLNMHAQKTRSQLSYEKVAAVGPDDIKTCSMRAVVNGKPYREGVGINKKEAKQNAAKNALRGLEEPVDLTENVAAVSTASLPPLRTNYISWLNEYGQKEKVAVIHVESIEPGPNFSQSCKFVIGGKEYPTGKGKTKKEAKEEAAKMAYHEICGSRTTETEDGKSTGTSFQQEEELRQSVTESSDTSRRLSVKKEDEGFIEQEIPQVQSDCNSKLISGLSTSSSWDCSSESAPTSSSDIFSESSSSSKEQDSSKNKNIGKGTKETSTHSRFASDFDSIKCLGKGGYGHVYKARDILMDEHFAIKIVRFREKVLKEVKALLKLHHTNIVRYFHCWTEDTEHQCENTTGSHSSTPISSSTSTSTSTSSQYLYIQMELCEKETLKDWINDKNQETLQSSTRAAQSRPIAYQIVCGVECIHQRFIHRDLKPANIMFGQDGEVKIGDFGLVTTEMDDDDENQRERTEDAGTRSYMAPEQKNKTYNNKVDIFALGLIYLELLWKMSTESEKAAVFTKAKGQTLPEDFLKTFPQESKIIMTMLSKNPEERPEARVLKAEMEKL